MIFVVKVHLVRYVPYRHVRELFEIRAAFFEPFGEDIPVDSYTEMLFENVLNGFYAFSRFFGDIRVGDGFVEIEIYCLPDLLGEEDVRFLCERRVMEFA